MEHTQATTPTPATTPTFRVFFIPFFASGHMLPMVDLARLFAARPGVEPIMVVTPANADLIRPMLNSSAAAGIHVGLLLYPFPSAEVGLPHGKENLSDVTQDEEWRIHKAVELSREAHRRVLHEHRPDAVIADVPYYWTTAFAAELDIPRVTFHPVGVFPQCVMQMLYTHPPPKGADNAPFIVPELPGSKSVDLVQSELPGFLRSPNHLTKAWEKIRSAQLNCFGAVVNTFYEFEPEFCEWYKKNNCPNDMTWFVGPMSLSHDDDNVAEKRGGAEASEKWDKCQRWLDGKAEGSVVFVCLGSWYSSDDEQLREMALGLEESGRPFLWVMRGVGGKGWMPSAGWEERLGVQGLLLTGWAPQVKILNHRAIGAFISHCGWNSIMETVAAGVPLLTWPLVFEQFINERLVTVIHGMGERVWGGFRSTMKEEKVVVPAAIIASVVAEFMKPGGKREAAQQQIREYSKKARAAIAEGGSSFKDVNCLIDKLQAWHPRP